MLLIELYQEEKGGSFTHDGNEYDLNTVLKATDKQDVIQVPVSDLKWEAEGESIESAEEQRIKDADITKPILVTKWKDQDETKLVTVDGFHRLMKAIRDGVKHLPGRMVSKSQLKDALIS